MIDNGKFQGESKCGMVPIHEAEDSLLMGGQGRAEYGLYKLDIRNGEVNCLRATEKAS